MKTTATFKKIYIVLSSQNMDVSTIIWIWSYKIIWWQGLK